MNVYKIGLALDTVNQYKAKYKNSKIKWLYKYRIKKVKNKIKKELNEDTLDRDILTYEDMLALYDLTKFLYDYIGDDSDDFSLTVYDDVDYHVIKIGKYSEYCGFNVISVTTTLSISRKGFTKMIKLHTESDNDDMLFRNSYYTYSNFIKEECCGANEFFIDNLVYILNKMIDKTFDMIWSN